MKKVVRRFFILLIGVMAIICSMKATYKSENIDYSKDISQKIIRFHVRANSDSQRDQDLKMCVKKEVVNYLEPLLKDSKDINESRDIIAKHQDEIKALAENTLKENDSQQNVKVYFEDAFFPIKTYGDMTFPPGEYEAFRIDIGEAQGKNWWCVLYPPLCFIDTTCTFVPEESKDRFKNILTEEEYNAITKRHCQYEFKYIKFLNKVFDL